MYQIYVSKCLMVEDLAYKTVGIELTMSYHKRDMLSSIIKMFTICSSLRVPTLSFDFCFDTSDILGLACVSCYSVCRLEFLKYVFFTDCSEEGN